MVGWRFWWSFSLRSSLSLYFAPTAAFAAKLVGTARDRQWRALLIRAMKEEARLERFTLKSPSGEVFNVVPNLEPQKFAPPKDLDA